MSDSWVDEYVQKDVSEHQTVYQGRIWDIVHDTFQIGTYEVSRDYMRHTGAVAILAVNDQDEILTIRQYRQPVGAYLIEVPAGLLDQTDEDPLVAAQRELLEEAGYIAQQWSVLTDFFTTPGSSSEAVRIYLAQQIELANVNREHLDEEESEIEVRWVPRAEALACIQAGTWQSPTLLVSVLSYVAFSQTRSAQASWNAREHLLRTKRVQILDTP